MATAAGLSIKRIAAHQQHSVPLLVLSETAQQTALPLMEAMVREGLGHGLGIVAVCLEQLLSRDIMCQPKVALVDCRPTMAQIGDGSAFLPNGTRRIDLARLDSDVCSQIERISAVSGGFVVVIDDLEPLLNISQVDTLALLRKFRSVAKQSQSSRILARYSRDTANQHADKGGSHLPLVPNVLQSIADAVVDVYRMDVLGSWMPGWYSNGEVQPFVSLGDNDERQGLLRLEHRRQSGKVGYELAAFEINVQQRPVFSAVKAVAAVEPLSAATAGPDPRQHLPFNLDLTDKQRQDRADVELPYLEAQAGEIHYQMAEEDDWDEDDPDDDLEI
ncbi:Elongator complex protein [Coemansia sp. RSA 720]|nr:Elongator complex protein [Coemansia sp. RSA 720]